MKYLKGLDTLRAFAVTIVLIWHYIPRQAYNTTLGVFAQFLLPTGVFGVTFFFVLSGYLITNILLKAREGSDNKGRIIKSFIIRRALRIFPIYYLMLVVLLLIQYPITLGTVPYLLTYTSNIFISANREWISLGHTWSLSVEEQFYLIFPWLIIFIKQKNLKYVFPAFIIIGMASSFYISRIHMITFDDPAMVSTTACFGAFGIGGGYAFLSRQQNGEVVLTKWIKTIFFLALSVAIYWKVCPYYNVPPKLFFLERTNSSLLALGIIHFTINNKSLVLKRYLFENKTLNLIGRVSYGIYLYHYSFAFYFHQATDYLLKVYPTLEMINNVYILFVIKTVIVFVISYFSFAFIEKHILFWKGRFEYIEEKETKSKSKRLLTVLEQD